MYTEVKAMPIDLSADFLFFLGLLVLFVVGMYLFVRRILINFREGIEQGRR